MDQQEWNQIIKKHQRMVFSAALSVVKDTGDADDITQDVFIKLYTHIDTLRDPKAIKGWLIKTAYNRAKDHLRFKKVRRLFFQKQKSEEEISSTTPESDVELKQQLDIIKMWQEAKLSKKENLILQLKKSQDLTFEELASALKMNISSVKTHYYRAIEKMKKMVKKEG